MAGASKAKRHSSISMWSRGGLTWKAIFRQLWLRCFSHDLIDRASLLSFYFLLAFFPLLILLSSLTGLILTSQTQTYWRLLDYLARAMPPSALELFTNVLLQLRSDATGGKLSLGLVLSLWTASSGIAALIEALNIAFEVPIGRSWWRRRLIATALTLGISVVLTISLLLLVVTSSAGAFLVGKLAYMSALSSLSSVARWLVDAALLFTSLTLIYGFGPNLNRKHWQGILPGTCFAMVCWVLTSLGLRLYLSTFGSLSRSYGSIAGVIALMFWLWTAAIAILLGGELNAIIWQATVATRERRIEPSAPSEAHIEAAEGYRGL